MLGTVGSSHRLDTTLISDSVNLAARLEKLTQYYRVAIILSEMTYEALSESQIQYIREIDLVSVKGHSEPCLIYDAFSSDSEEVKENKLETAEVLKEAIFNYRHRKFRDAYELFKRMKEKCPEDILPVLYMKRCLDYVKNPPHEEWNAAFPIHY